MKHMLNGMSQVQFLWFCGVAYNGACFSFSVLLGVLASGFSIGYTNTYFLWNVALFMKSVWDCDTESSIYTHFAWFQTH
jgi:hypothetical protein